MELNVNSGATNANINSKANSEFNRRGDHRLAKRIVTTRGHFQKPYGRMKLKLVIKIMKSSWKIV